MQLSKTVQCIRIYSRLVYLYIDKSTDQNWESGGKYMKKKRVTKIQGTDRGKDRLAANRMDKFLQYIYQNYSYRLHFSNEEYEAV